MANSQTKTDRDIIFDFRQDRLDREKPGRTPTGGPVAYECSCFTVSTQYPQLESKYRPHQLTFYGCRRNINGWNPNAGRIYGLLREIESFLFRRDFSSPLLQSPSFSTSTTTTHSRSPSSQQYATPLNSAPAKSRMDGTECYNRGLQRQLSPIGPSVPGQHILVMNQFTPTSFAQISHPSSPAGLVVAYPQMAQHIPQAPYGPVLNNQTSYAPMGPPATANHHHTQRHSTSYRQASPFQRLSRSASSLSDIWQRTYLALRKTL
ncbi:hypothetical protein EG327_001531 [Venturia inaequalis]|uniref:Uncharacterized protein n=1 Tax=Venturia inaequalis TaxID=5025 RepID=A0A8H3VP50_VENIN|nr:hypothetical protein EG327_001531 [Venturia inaequalis]